MFTICQMDSVNCDFQSGKWCSCVATQTKDHRNSVVMHLQDQMKMSRIFLKTICTTQKIATNVSNIIISYVYICCRYRLVFSIYTILCESKNAVYYKSQ